MALLRTDKPLIQLELCGCLVEAAGVEPVPAILITGDGARLPKIGLDPPRNLLPSPSPGVPCSPLQSPAVPCSPLESSGVPPVLETFWRRDPCSAAQPSRQDREMTRRLPYGRLLESRTVVDGRPTSSIADTEEIP